MPSRVCIGCRTHRPSYQAGDIVKLVITLAATDGRSDHKTIAAPAPLKPLDSKRTAASSLFAAPSAWGGDTAGEADGGGGGSGGGGGGSGSVPGGMMAMTAAASSSSTSQSINPTMAVLQCLDMKVQLVGEVRVDTARLDLDAVKATIGEPVGRLDSRLKAGVDTTDRDTTHIDLPLFISPTVVVPIQAPLCALERRCAYVTFRLPPHLPPSYRGAAVRLSYSVTILCDFTAGSGAPAAHSTPAAATGMSSSSSSSSVLKFPLRVASITAASHPTAAPFVDPTFDFEADFLVLPSQPTPTVASPTSDQLLVTQRRPVWGTGASKHWMLAGSPKWWAAPLGSGGVAATTSTATTENPTTSHITLLPPLIAPPLEQLLMWKGETVATISLAADRWRMGDTIRLSARMSSSSPWRCLRMVASLCADELVPVRLLKRGTQMGQQQQRQILILPASSSDEGGSNSPGSGRGGSPLLPSSGSPTTGNSPHHHAAGGGSGGTTTRAAANGGLDHPQQQQQQHIGACCVMNRRIIDEVESFPAWMDHVAVDLSVPVAIEATMPAANHSMLTNVAVAAFVVVVTASIARTQDVMAPGNTSIQCLPEALSVQFPVFVYPPVLSSGAASDGGRLGPLMMSAA